MRKLAYISTIKNLEAIEGADQIVKATVLGWTVVVKKGEFNIGDKCIYIEIDSKLKDIEAFEFLRSRKFKIKIIKLKGVISYGIVFPLSILSQKHVLDEGWEYIPQKNTIYSNMTNIVLEDDVDLSDVLGIEKYDLEEGESLQSVKRFKLNPNKSKIANKINYFKWKIKIWWNKKFNIQNNKSDFPKHLCPKSDENRIQGYSEYALIDMKGKIFTQSVKMDGSSMTVIRYKKTFFKKTFFVCSRNLSLKEDKNDRFWKMVNKYDLKNKLNKYEKNIALQMELIGESVQGNRYNIKGNSIRLFNVYDIDNKKYLKPKEMLKVANDLNIPHVDIVNEKFIFNHTVNELLELATQKSTENPLVDEEGFVFILNDGDKKLSFKVINPNYLLEKERNENKNKKGN